jgi:molybdenum ABC transporter molybdate-binding protein
LFDSAFALIDRAPISKVEPRELAVRIFVSATLVCAAALVAPLAAHARDLVLYGEPTLEPALRSIGTLWQARSGKRVNVFVAPSDLSYAQIERGARCDVIFALAGAETDTAARNKVIDAGTARRVLRNGLTLIGSAPGGAPKAELTFADLPQLIAGKRLAIANPGRDPAGARAVDLLRKAGVAVDDGNRTIAVAESSAGVASMLAIGKAQLGIVYASDATAGGFPLARPLSADQPPIEYVVAQARDPVSDTKPFLAFLKSPEAQATFKAAGLLPIDE